MVGHLEIGERVGMAGGVRAEQVTESGVLPGFVERDPVFGAVAEGFDDDFGVIGKILGHIAPGETAAQILERLGRVPMEQGDVGRDVAGQQQVNQAAVVIQAFLVDLSAPGGEHAAPGDGEAIGVQAELGHQGQVALGVAVGIAGHIGIFAGADFAGGVGEGVPNGAAFAIRAGASFNLEGGSGGAEQEVGWKFRVGHESIFRIQPAWCGVSDWQKAEPGFLLLYAYRFRIFYVSSVLSLSDVFASCMAFSTFTKGKTISPAMK